MTIAFISIMESNVFTIKVQCLVTACGWDEWGNPTRVKLSTGNEEDYRVVENDLGKDLLLYLQSWVEVEGVSREKNLIEVIKVKCIKENKTG